MQVRQIAVGPYQTNCYLLEDDIKGRCWMIDPGNNAPFLVDEVKRSSLKLEAILLTHAHWDHITGLPGVHEAFPSAPIYVGENEREFLGSGALKRFQETGGDGEFFLRYQDELSRLPSATVLLKGGETILDGLFQVIATPGHTKGGMCYYQAEEHLLFSGDTLFCGSIGRTDFYGGSYAELISSVKALASLPDDTTVLPGHGPQSTIAQEKRSNPFLV